MDRHRAWQRAEDFAGPGRSENLPTGPLPQHPRIQLGSLLVSHIHVIFDAVKVGAQLLRVDNLICLLSADIDNGENGCVGRGYVGLEAGCARKPTRFIVVTLSQVGATGLFLLGVEADVPEVAYFDRVCQPVEEPRLA